MAIEIGAVLEGKVTGITKFGAFVALEEGKSGLVHISEVANTYVTNVGDFLTQGQNVKVKVVGIDENGRINLSIKKALPQPEQNERSGRGAGAKQQTAQSAQEIFEDKLRQFMQESDSRFNDINRNNAKRSGGRRR